MYFEKLIVCLCIQVELNAVFTNFKYDDYEENDKKRPDTPKHNIYTHVFQHK